MSELKDNACPGPVRAERATIVQTVKHWSRPITIVAVVLLILVSYFWASYEQQAEIPFEPDSTREVGAVRIETRIAPRVLTPDEQAILSVIVDNRSDAALLTPYFELDAPGFVAVKPLHLMPVIAARTTHVAAVPLRAGTVVGRYRLRIKVAWNDSNRQQQSAIVLLPPPVTVRTGTTRFLWMATAVQSIAKDLALPVIVVLLAAKFKRNDDRRNQAREAEEKRAKADLEAKEESERNERETKQRDEERLRQTWDLMLPTHHQNVKRYYLPLRVAFLEFNRYYPAFAQNRITPEEKNAQMAFFAFLIFFWRWKRMREGIGGFIFKNSHGEIVASLALLLIRSETDEWFDHQREEVVDLLGRTTITFATFKGKWAENKLFQDLFEKFKNWNSAPSRNPLPTDSTQEVARLSLAEIVDTMKAFDTIMGFESDRPYESWYGARVDFPVEDVQAFCDTPVFGDPRLREFRKHLKRYLEVLKEPYSVNISWPEP